MLSVKLLPSGYFEILLVAKNWLRYWLSVVSYLSFHKFEFDGKELTQREAIDYILEAFKDYLILENITQEENMDLYLEKCDEVRINVEKSFALLGKILPALWW